MINISSGIPEERPPCLPHKLKPSNGTQDWWSPNTAFQIVTAYINWWYQLQIIANIKHTHTNTNTTHTRMPVHTHTNTTNMHVHNHTSHMHAKTHHTRIYTTHSHTHQSCSPRVWNQQAAPWPPFCGWVVCSVMFLTEPQHQCHPQDLPENRKITHYQLQRNREEEYNVLSTTYTKTCNIKTMQYQLRTGIQYALNYFTQKHTQESNVTSTTLHKNIGIQCALNYFTQKHTQESSVTSATLHKNIHRNPMWPQLLYTKIYTEIQCVHVKQEYNVLATTRIGSGIYSDYKALSPTQRYKTRTQHVINRISSWQRGINHWHNVLPNAQRHTTGIQ